MPAFRVENAETVGWCARDGESGEEKDSDVVPTFVGISCHLPGTSLLLPLNHRPLSSPPDPSYLSGPAAGHESFDLHAKSRYPRPVLLLSINKGEDNGHSRRRGVQDSPNVSFAPFVASLEYSARRLVREMRHLCRGIRTVFGSRMKREKKA